MDSADVASIVMAAIGLVGVAFTYFKGRSLAKASAAESLSNAASKLVERYEERLEHVEIKLKEQEEEIDKLKKENEDFVRGVQALCNQIRGLGHKPVWEPNWEPK